MFPLTLISPRRRPAAAGGFPRSRQLRRLQPRPHRHLPHPLQQFGGDQLGRSLHQPDRHRPPVGSRALVSLMLAVILTVEVKNKKMFQFCSS